MTYILNCGRLLRPKLRSNSGRVRTRLLILMVIGGCFSGIQAGQTNIGTVDYCENGQISVTNQSGMSISRGMRLEVLDYKGRSVAVLRVLDGSPQYSAEGFLCRVVRGSTDIRPGYSVRSRSGLGWALVVDAVSFPVEIGRYQGAYVTDRGRYFAVSACFDPRSMKDWGRHGPGCPLIGTAVVDFRSFWAWEIGHLGYMFNLEIVPEYFRVQIGGLGGVLLGVSNVKWQTPEGVSYDSLGTSGQAHPGIFWSYRGFVGLSYQLSRRIRPYVRIAYFGYTTPKYSDVDSYNQETGDHFLIDEAYLSKRLEGIGGLSYQAGIEFWFNP